MLAHRRSRNQGSLIHLDYSDPSPNHMRRGYASRYDDATDVIKLTPDGVLITELARLASDARGHTIEARDVCHLKIKINERIYRCEINR